MATKKTKKTMKSSQGSKKKASPVTKKLGPVSKTFSKSEILNTVANQSELTQKQARAAIETLYLIIEHHVKKSGPGVFIMPGLLKIHVVNKPATKARKGINPFTGEETMFKAKPARKVVKVKALKRLKEMV